MNFAVPIIIIPAIFFVLSRFLNSTANHCLVTKSFRKTNKRPIKFYTMGKKRYLLISIFCAEKEVAKKVIIYSILSIVNTFFMIASALITYYFRIKYLPIIFLGLGVIIIINIIVTADYYDRTVWTWRR